MIPLLIAGAAFVVFVLATRPEETRENRWVKIIPSTLLVWLAAALATAGVAGAFMAFLTFVLLTLIWAPVYSHYLSGGIMNLFHGFHTDEGGFRTDYSEARVKIDQGELAQAVKAVEHELRKDPVNYEGRLLLASLYRELGKPADAAAQLEVILRNPLATADQKRFALAGQEQLRHESGPGS